jgi:hypothetical protein
MHTFKSRSHVDPLLWMTSGISVNTGGTCVGCREE